MSTINDFVSKMGYGARANLFKVLIGRFGFADTEFFVKAAQIPGRTMGVTPVRYKNNIINLVGDTSVFPEWSCTVINDEYFTIRNALEEWIEEIKSADETDRSFFPLYGSIDVISYSPDMDMIANYHIFNAFPTDLGAVDLSWDSSDTIQEYTVTFNYTYWQRIS
jgi:hypothetical protein